MKLTTPVVLLVATLVAPGTGTAQHAPPPPCDTVQITSELRRCGSAVLLAAEQTLQRYAQEARRLASRPEVFDSAQASWERYRDLACRGAGTQYEGGTLQPVTVLFCRVALTRRRARDVWEHYLADEDGSLPQPEPPSHGGAAQTPACADSVTRTLAPLIGSWDVRAVFRDGERWDSAAARVDIQRDFEGCLLRERFSGTRGGQPFHVLSLWGAAGLNAPIQRTFVHSQHGLIGLFAGHVHPDGLVLRDSQTVNGQLLYFEHRFNPFVGDSMRFTSLRSTDRGTTWRVTWYAHYRRRAS